MDQIGKEAEERRNGKSAGGGGTQVNREGPAGGSRGGKAALNKGLNRHARSKAQPGHNWATVRRQGRIATR